MIKFGKNFDKVTGTKTVEHKDLLTFQGDLKRISKKNLEKLTGRKREVIL